MIFTKSEGSVLLDKLLHSKIHLNVTDLHKAPALMILVVSNYNMEFLMAGLSQIALHALMLLHFELGLLH